MTAGKKSLPLRWLPIAWLGLAFTSFVFVIFGMIEQGDPTQLIERKFGDAGLFAFMLYGLGVVIALFVLRRLLYRHDLGWRDVGVTGGFTRTAFLYGVGGWLVAFLLYYGISSAVEAAGIRMFWNEGAFFALDSVWRVAGIVLAAVIVAPVAEEILYRGYVLGALLDRFSPVVAAVLSALIFASIHVTVGPGMVIYLFVGALIPAYLFIRFRSVAPCILMHFLNNVVAYLVIPLLFKGE